MTSDASGSPLPENADQQTRTIHMSQHVAGNAIGPYRLIRQLGEGGMGVVYHAQQLHPIRRDVALKIIKPGMDSKQVISRFESERQAVAMMDHPNIAHVLDAGTTDRGLPYFAMELVDGLPITRHCDAKRLTVPQRLELFIQTCKAIQHAHQKGIIHRDVKPSNILVTEHDDRSLPKVIDFGLAKALAGHIANATAMTNFETVVGTLAYMSPEQAEIGRQDIDTRSDVYSLGAVLYELLTGTTPLAEDRLANVSYVEALRRIREEEARRPSAQLLQSPELVKIAGLRQYDPARLPKLLRGELDWIVLKALDKDRNRRYETVNGLARDLQRYLTGEPVEAAPPSATYRTRKFVAKHRAWLATATAFVMLLAAGVFVSTGMAVRARRAERQALAINEFLQNDLLAQASSDNQARPGTPPDPNLTVRTALDRAAASLGSRFAAEPLLEASIRHTIGLTYARMNLNSEAAPQLERALDLRRKLLGELHPDTLTSMHSYAIALHVEGKYDQVEPLYLRVLELKRRVLGKEHLHTLRTTINLGGLYVESGRYDAAEAICVPLSDVLRRVLGNEHPLTLNALGNLGATYHWQRKFGQAEALYSQVLDARRRVRGDEHPETLSATTNMAELYADQGLFEKAAPLYAASLAIQRRTLGEYHRHTIFTMSSLASLHLKQRKFEEAESGYLEAVEASRHGLDSGHPLTLDILNGLADSFRGQSKYAQAEKTYSEVLEARRHALGPEHPATIHTLASLGNVQLEQGHYKAAETALRLAATLYEKTKATGWERYECESLLGASIFRQKRFAESEPLLMSGYEGLVQRAAMIPAGNRSTVNDAVQRLIRLFADWGKSDLAEAWMQKLDNPSTVAR
jgi:eukaryotic-like serine/threonine-protein kinase